MPDFDSNQINSSMILINVFIFASARCPDPTPPANGVVKLALPPDYGRLYDFGSTALFACDDGYKLEGSPIAKCQLYGTWSEVTPTCKKRGSLHFPV